MKGICNRQFAFVRGRWIAALACAAIVAVYLAVHWSPARVVARKQAALMTALDKRGDRRMERLIAEDYADDWGLKRGDLVRGFLELGGQFFVFHVAPDGEFEQTVADGRATVSARLTLSGNGSPIAQEIMRVANRLEAPFVFTWEKRGFWPGDWRLTRLANEDVPKSLYGYRPGDLEGMLDRF
ncbi:MAG: hypothetical protein KDM91_23325 [Verrucomicrobiae bacterium]|nr:hypothetical protein [Verrucomicrobiae bacterium]MCP5540617.1 hypothetical protein [Akkermansiaceae bacterium]